MHRIKKTSKPAAAALLLLLLATLVLAACGGSSTGSATGASATSSTGSTNSAPGGGRFAAVRECLQKNGITLTRRTPGQRPRQGGGLLGGRGTPALPSGVTRAQYEAALKKCGAGAFRGGARRNSTAFKQALPKFAACMRENGINLPTPNTSGNGPVFDVKGLNTSGTQFKSAQAKCQPILTAARGQAGPGGRPPGAPEA
ncbi:MAG TPA: hypothetical protein VGH78_06475 [Solirubrobacteraceae bacterium]